MVLNLVDSAVALKFCGGVDFSFQKSIIKDNFIHEFVSVWGKVVYWQEIKEFILQKK